VECHDRGNASFNVGLGSGNNNFGQPQHTWT
jgi:hypothetical protein